MTAGGFLYFAKRNNLDFEIADKNKFYDIILLPAPSNLSQWLIYKKRHPKTRFIFEMVDSLIFPSDTFTTVFKGVGGFMIGKETMPYLDYKRLLVKMVESCGSCNLFKCGIKKGCREME